MTGIQLGANCPIDCPTYELNGQMKYKTSSAALEAFNSYFEIRDVNKNKAELEKIEVQIKETEKGFGNISK